jgi:hypothetical protein
MAEQGSERQGLDGEREWRVAKKKPAIGSPAMVFGVGAFYCTVKDTVWVWVTVPSVAVTVMV